MHSEWGEVTKATAEALNATRAAGGRLIAVGTTVTRLLETAVRSHESKAHQSTANQCVIPAWQGRSDLFIRPPFSFRAIDALMTNFHFPRTTLLVLVQTFAGRELVAEAYRQAIEEQYRFYSYGDAMLII
jgi:S-adenosylmethionine:tRNA ribosyltransferase-isomerase